MENCISLDENVDDSCDVQKQEESKSHQEQGPIDNHKLAEPAKMTIYRGARPLGKKVFGNERGEIIKQAGSQQVIEGSTVEVTSVHDLYACHKSFSSNDYAFGYGIAKDSGLAKIYRIGLKNKSKDGEKTRTNADFELPANMVIMVDLDAYGDLTPDEQLAKFFEINPELVKIDHIVRPSCSSYIYNPEKEGDEPKVKGYHLYFFCKSSELQQIIDLLWNRCVLAGFVRTILSKSGAILVRSLFDISIYQPCRMDFIGPVICKPPLKQLPLESKVVLGDKAMLLLEDLKQLSEKQIADAKNIIYRMKEELKPRSKQRKKEFREEMVSQLPAKERKAKREMLEKAMEESILEPETVIWVHTDEGIKDVTVSEILKNPEEYNKLRCCDPIDPSYKDYSPCAIINLDGASQNIYDFHTDTTYWLGEIKQSALVPVVEEKSVILGKYYLPEGYFADDGCIYKITDDEKGSYKLVMKSIVAVSRRILNEDGTVLLTISYDDNGVTRNTRSIPRKEIACRDVLNLADYEIDVNLNNYTAVSSFLMDMASENRYGSIVEAIGLKTLGFAKLNDSRIFLTGTEYISSDGIHNIIPKDGSASSIEFIYPDTGTKILFESVCRKGSREAWIEAVKKLNEYPYVKIAVATAACTPLLKLLGLPNFIIHFGYPSSSGKSSCLKIAASAVGDSEHLIVNWNSTFNSINNKAYYLSSLPLFLDETKAIIAKNKDEVIRNVIYMFSSGISRSRADKNGGLKENLGWNSVCFSTGEANLLYEVKDGGARARVLDLSGMPFNRRSNEIGDMIDSVLSVVQENYGHAVVEVMADVLREGSNSLTEYKARHEELCVGVRKALPPGIGIRLAKLVAFIVLSVEIMNKVMSLEWTTDDVRSTLVDCAVKQAVSDSEGNKALSYIYNYSIANLGELCNSQGSDCSYVPSYIKNEKKIIRSHRIIQKGQAKIGIIGEDCLIIIDSFIKDILKDAKFEPDSVFKEWKQKGYLKYIGEGFTTQPKLFGNRPRVIYLNAAAMKALGHNQDTVCDSEETEKKEPAASNPFIG